MPDFTIEHERMLTETYHNVIQMSTVLLDTNGNKGLASRVQDACLRMEEQADESAEALTLVRQELEAKIVEVRAATSNNNRAIVALVAFLVGSGVLGGSFYGISQLIG